MSRWLQLGLALCLAAACSGDEPAPQPGAGQAAAAEQPGPPTGAQWWSQARSLNEAEPEEADAEDPRALVSCRLGSGSRFMRRGDCLVQGGRPERS